MKNYVITIARGFGSHGKEIAVKLSEQLGIPCYDNQILSMASQQSGINESLFMDVNEKLRGSYIRKLLSPTPLTYAVEASDKNFISDVNLFNIQAEIIRELARSESCIILGKAANDVLADMPNVVSVYVNASKEFCISSIMKKMYVSEKEAAKLVHRTNKYRSDYFKFYSGGKDWESPLNYDLCINTEKTGTELAVKTIKDFTAAKLNLEL